MNIVQKRKKTMAQERASHLAMQRRRDGLARLRAGQVANLHLVSGEELRVRPYDPKKEDPLNPYNPFRVLILHNQRLVAVTLHEKNCELGVAEGVVPSRNPRESTYRRWRKLHCSDVLGVVMP